MFFSNISRNSVYLDAKKYLFEYLDISNIIKRLQDIDKLKMVLFDNQQLQAFEMLPKPTITKKGHAVGSIRMDSIAKSQSFRSMKDNPMNKIEMLLQEDNQINKKIFSLLDPKLKADYYEMRANFFI